MASIALPSDSLLEYLSLLSEKSQKIQAYSF